MSRKVKQLYIPINSGVSDEVSSVFERSKTNYTQHQSIEIEESYDYCALLFLKSRQDYIFSPINDDIEIYEVKDYNISMNEFDEDILRLSAKLNIPLHERHRFRNAILSFIPTMTLPEKAPKLYSDRPKNQHILDFLRDAEGWGPYIKAGVLTRADLLALDKPAYTALANWLRKPENELPPDIDLPPKRTLTDRRAAEATSVGERPARVDWALRSRRRHATNG